MVSGKVEDKKCQEMLHMQMPRISGLSMKTFMAAFVSFGCGDWACDH